MILLDTSGLLAALVASQDGHEAARRVLEESSEPLVLTPFVLAELDDLIARWLTVRERAELMREVEAGTYRLDSFEARDVGEARRVVERYADQGIGLTDASIVVLAGRLGTEQILTFDERHFRVLRAPNGHPFTVLPADAGP